MATEEAQPGVPRGTAETVRGANGAPVGSAADDASAATDARGADEPACDWSGPDEALWEAIEVKVAGGGCPDARLAEHLRTCQRCAGRVKAAGEELSFLTHVRSVLRPALAEEGGPAGLHIRGYVLQRILSRGAQGVVYLARQESTSRLVAIKLLNAGHTIYGTNGGGAGGNGGGGTAGSLGGSGGSGGGVSLRQRARAEREAEIAGGLRHPSIVTVYESRRLEHGQLAVVMEYIDGVPIDQWSPGGADPVARRREILLVFISICEAIHHAHLNGVIHRDLKPDNILVTAEGRPVVLDFGIAKSRHFLNATRTGEFAGTPAYASPEQVSGMPEQVDALVDVYALGVLLYRLVCGAMPYELTGSLVQMARTIEQAPPTPPKKCDPSIPTDLQAIILKAIEKSKAERYQSAAAMARDLRRLLAGEPVEARSHSGWYILRKAVAVNRWRLLGAALAALVLISAGVTVAISQARASLADRQAQERAAQAQRERVRARAVTELLREAVPNSDPDNPEVRAAVSLGLTRLFFRLETGAFSDDAGVDQALRRLWGEVYTGFGNTKGVWFVEYAEVSLRNGLIELRQRTGENRAEIAETLHNLAGVVLLRGRAEEAKGLCGEALALRLAVFGSESTPALESRHLLARILFALGRYGEAEKLSQEVLAAYRERPEAEADLPIAALLGLQSQRAIAAGQLGAAGDLLQETLVRRLRRLPPDDPEVLRTLADVGDWAARGWIQPTALGSADGNRGPALAALLAEIWADGNKDSASVASLLAVDVTSLRKQDKGNFSMHVPTGRAAALARLLALSRTLLGPEHPAIVRVLIAHMKAADGEGLLDSKVESLRAAAALLGKLHGATDRRVVVCLDEAAVSLAVLGRMAEAAEAADQSNRIRESVPPEAKDQIVLASGERFGAWCHSLAGHQETAERLYLSADRRFTAGLGPGSYLNALTRSGLAYCKLAMGKLAEADAMSEEAHALAVASRSIHSDQMAHVKCARGLVLVELGRGDEAAEMLAEAWMLFYRFLYPDNPWRIKLVEHQIANARANGQAELAKWWETHRRFIGGSAPYTESTPPEPMRGH